MLSSSRVILVEKYVYAVFATTTINFNPSILMLEPTRASASPTIHIFSTTLLQHAEGVNVIAIWFSSSLPWLNIIPLSFFQVSPWIYYGNKWRCTKLSKEQPRNSGFADPPHDLGDLLPATGYVLTCCYSLRRREGVSGKQPPRTDGPTNTPTP